LLLPLDPFGNGHAKSGLTALDCIVRRWPAGCFCQERLDIPLTDADPDAGELL
jgi:hypothetical protein